MSGLVSDDSNCRELGLPNERKAKSRSAKHDKQCLCLRCVANICDNGDP